MCGIIGYIGTRQARPVLIEGLKRLEYRGYDSAGIATIEPGYYASALQLSVYKQPGKIQNLEEYLKGLNHPGTLGIGHTRWATHGEPSERNAHPHISGTLVPGMMFSELAVVHNGIVENYESLRAELRAEGYCFLSDTDTEVLPHLIARELKRGSKSLEDAVAHALVYVEGAYAIAVISCNHPDTVVAACNSSPLVIGIGTDELYLASDEAALAGNVSAVVHLKDGDLAVLERNGSYRFRGLSIAEAAARREAPQVQTGDISKGSYAHYMLKEIHEQPQALKNALATHLRDGQPIRFGGLTGDMEARLTDARRIVLAACGTSLFAAMAGTSPIECIGGVMCQAEQSAEFAYRDPVLSSADVVIGISQSGETADTLKAMALAKDRHALCLSITNRVGSTLAKRTRLGMYLHAGPEIAVASTKAFTSQVAMLLLFALRLAELRGRDVSEALVRDMARLPQLVGDALKRDGEMQALAQKYASAKRMILIGRGPGVPLALEGALKIREVAYLDAHGLSASELKHGTLALVEKGVPVIALVPSGALRSKTLSNLEEVKARGGDVIPLEMPEGVSEELLPIVLAPLVQLLAYHLGVLRGVDVDQPRNLAKSVTVE